uniref:LexA family transcriptional regulator n=1 Tax=Ornithobacterium rhinotracheale TaxID=28251 RepID=UPI0016263584|nr:S24 family peptidase [Ornithobacterium rhinotracheale]
MRKKIYKMRKKIDKSFILNEIKRHLGFSSDSEFARFLDIKPQTLSSWHSRNTFDIDLIYSKCVNINPEFLLSGKGAVLKTKCAEITNEKNVSENVSKNVSERNVQNLLTNEDEKPNVEKTPQNKNVVNNVANNVANQKLEKSHKNNIERKVPQVVTVTSHQEDNIVLVPVAAQAGYLTGYDDPTFMEGLPTYNLPNIRNGIFRMFQVSGLSMYPTLQNNSYVVGQFVEDWLHLSDNRVCVVVTQEHGVIVKRVLNRIAKYGNLYCKSDNRDYPNISVAPEDIKEIWECKMHLSFEFLDPATVYNKLSDLEADVMHLTERLNRYEENK